MEAGVDCGRRHQGKGVTVAALRGREVVRGGGGGGGVGAEDRRLDGAEDGQSTELDEGRLLLGGPLRPQT